MGLTNYWQRPAIIPSDRFSRILTDVQLLLPHMGVALAGVEGIGKPVVTAEMIGMNGQTPNAVEPFVLRQAEIDLRGDGVVRQYCKTEGLPYDLAVKAVLIVLRQHIGDDYKISSDQSEHGWDAARAVTQRVLRYGSQFQIDLD